jgi:adenine deaminase
MSTVNSAHALGLVDKVGVIDVGNYADIIVVSDLDNKGLDNFSRKKPDDVLAVFVGGELIAGEQGKFLDGTMGKNCLATYEHKFICIDFEKGYQQTFEQIVAKNTKNVDLLTVEGQAQCEFP